MSGSGIKIDEKHILYPASLQAALIRETPETEVKLGIPKDLLESRIRLQELPVRYITQAYFKKESILLVVGFLSALGAGRIPRHTNWTQARIRRIGRCPFRTDGTQLPLPKFFIQAKEKKHQGTRGEIEMPIDADFFTFLLRAKHCANNGLIHKERFSVPSAIAKQCLPSDLKDRGSLDIAIDNIIAAGPESDYLREIDWKQPEAARNLKERGTFQIYTVDLEFRGKKGQNPFTEEEKTRTLEHIKNSGTFLSQAIPLDSVTIAGEKTVADFLSAPKIGKRGLNNGKVIHAVEVFCRLFE